MKCFLKFCFFSDFLQPIFVKGRRVAQNPGGILIRFVKRPEWAKIGRFFSQNIRLTPKSYQNFWFVLKTKIREKISKTLPPPPKKKISIFFGGKNNKKHIHFKQGKGFR